VPVPVPVPAPEPNMALRSAFGVTHTALSPPVHPVSNHGLDWAASVLDAEQQQLKAALDSWKAGMATVVHPFTQQQVSIEGRSIAYHSSVGSAAQWVMRWISDGAACACQNGGS
jgi:hypothetical protein